MSVLSQRITTILLCGLLAGCYGPTAIRQGFQDYSQTLHYNSQQQMLLNLVRLKYRETPFFLKVGALSVNYELETGAALGVDNIKDGNSPISLGIEPSVLEKPTVTYTPVEGDIFVKQMLAEIDPSVFVLLVRAGWHVDTLSRMIVDSIAAADGSTLDRAAYDALLQTLADAQSQRRLVFATNANEKIPTLKAGNIELPLARLRFRSFLDVMYELSKNVDVPTSQQDWVEPVSHRNDLLRVQPARFKSAEDYVSVKHHGYYFSIAQRDVASKNTFALLQTLYQMQAGEIKSVQPVLTLPIGK